MKVYEFSYQDKLNLSQEALNQRVFAFLQVECERQGWAKDFTFKLSSPPLKNAGHTEYHFDVYGRFLDSTSAPGEGEEIALPAKDNSAAAAPEQSI